MTRVVTPASCLLLWAAPSAAHPARGEVAGAMKKAAAFMAEKVSLRGGYVWTVSEDLTKRWGEIPARPSQVWVQGGTPMAGMARATTSSPSRRGRTDRSST